MLLCTLPRNDLVNGLRKALWIGNSVEFIKNRAELAPVPPKGVTGFGGQGRQRLVIDFFDQRLEKERDTANAHAAGERNPGGGSQAPASFQFPVMHIPRILLIGITVFVRRCVYCFARMPDCPLADGRSTQALSLNDALGDKTIESNLRHLCSTQQRNA